MRVYIYRSPHPHCNIILFILIQLLLNIFTILKWIIVYCPIYIGYLHSEPAWPAKLSTRPAARDRPVRPCTVQICSLYSPFHAQ